MTDFKPIRVSGFSRIYNLLFTILWCGLLLIFAVQSTAHKNVAGILVPGVLLVFGLLFFPRLGRVQVFEEDGALVIRNIRRTRSLRRNEIDDFRVQTDGSAFGGSSIAAVLHDGTMLSLDVTRQITLRWHGKQRQAQMLKQLREWLGDVDGQ